LTMENKMAGSIFFKSLILLIPDGFIGPVDDSAQIV
jgi:hypothetical protein